mmetsp:Transcript_39075/g.103100  ORF Transcript_39075/g.103100 Transcript_39075/m.103100 type:complete len:408 (-) Transcript_39075:1147-2370(-)
MAKPRLLDLAPGSGNGRGVIFGNPNADLRLQRSKSNDDGIPQMLDWPHGGCLAGKLQEHRPLLKLNPKLGLVKTFGSNNLGATGAITNQLRQHILQAWRVAVARTSVNWGKLDVDTITNYNQINEPVDKLSDRIHPSQAVVQSRPRIGRGVRAKIWRSDLAMAEYARGLIGGEDRCEFSLHPSIQFEVPENPAGVRHECVPLFERNRQVLVSFLHGSPSVALWTAGQVAHDLRHQELETMSLLQLIPPGDVPVCVERRIRHPSLHQCISQLGKPEDATATAVQRPRVAKHSLPRCNVCPRGGMPRRDDFLAQHPARCSNMHTFDRSCYRKIRRLCCRHLRIGNRVDYKIPVHLEYLNQCGPRGSRQMIRRNLGGGNQNRPRPPRHEQHRLLVTLGCDHLRAAADVTN